MTEVARYYSTRDHYTRGELKLGDRTLGAILAIRAVDIIAENLSIDMGDYLTLVEFNDVTCQILVYQKGAHMGFSLYEVYYQDDGEILQYNLDLEQVPQNPLHGP